MLNLEQLEPQFQRVSEKVGKNLLGVTSSNLVNILDNALQVKESAFGAVMLVIKEVSEYIYEFILGEENYISSLANEKNMYSK